MNTDLITSLITYSAKLDALYFSYIYGICLQEENRVKMMFILASCATDSSNLSLMLCVLVHVYTGILSHRQFELEFDAVCISPCLYWHPVPQTVRT